MVSKGKSHKIQIFSLCDIDTDGSISEIGFKIPHSLKIESADNSSVKISNSRQTFVFFGKYMFNCNLYYLKFHRKMRHRLTAKYLCLWSYHKLTANKFTSIV